MALASYTLPNHLTPVYREIDVGIPYNHDNISTLKRVVNFGTNIEHPIHGWYYFKEGFAPDMVKWALGEFAPGLVHWAMQRFLLPGWPDHILRRGARAVGYPAEQHGPLILDTFAGSGTTPLTCQMAGLDARGIEYNPFFAFLGSAKLAWPHYDPQRLTRYVDHLLAPGGIPTIEPPTLSSFNRLFNADALADLLLMKERIAQIDDPLSRQFFQVGLASVVERVSLARKDGKGLKVVKRPFVPAPVREALEHQWKRMLRDLTELADRREVALQADVSIQKGDARRLPGIGSNSVDLVVYSPPYLNSFDYAEVYKLEMWLLDFVQTYTEFRELRGASLRSHVSSAFETTAYFEYAPLAELVKVIDKARLWNPRIPSMIRGYFDDMYLVLSEQARTLKPGGHAVCVVANSAYAGVPIPTDAILARIGERVGLKIEGIFIARPMNTSAQQLARWGGDRGYLRESAVVLRKPSTM